MTITLKTKSIDSSFSASLAKLSSLDKDTEEALKEIGNAFAALVTDQFKTSTDPFGRGWIPLSKRRSRVKQRRGFTNQPLVATGRLSRSFTSAVTPKRLEFGSDRTFSKGITAADHQVGFNNADGTRTPPRAMLPLLGSTLPPLWDRAIEAAFLNLVRKL